MKDHLYTYPCSWSPQRSLSVYKLLFYSYTDRLSSLLSLSFVQKDLDDRCAFISCLCLNLQLHGVSVLPIIDVRDSYICNFSTWFSFSVNVFPGYFCCHLDIIVGIIMGYYDNISHAMKLWTKIRAGNCFISLSVYDFLVGRNLVTWKIKVGNYMLYI